MKILIVGDWHSEVHEKPVFNALLSFGHEVRAIKWHHYFSSKVGNFFWLKNFFVRLQNKFIIGPLIGKLQKKLIEEVIYFQPDIIFYYRGTHIVPSTLTKIKKILPICVQIGYNNDDPFADGHPKYLWRHFKACLPRYDLVLAYRHANIKEYFAGGAIRVELLRSWYIPERNYPLRLENDTKPEYKSDIIFIGHYENDGRVSCMEKIVEAGYKFKLYGPGYDWDQVLLKNKTLRHLVPVKLVWGEEYNFAINGAKIALCFLSKLNRDTYTRRCFEIPASGTMLLSEYTDDLDSLFKEGLEADYFRNEMEMMEKISFYLSNLPELSRVSSAGYSRVVSEGHDIYSRMRNMIESAVIIKDEKYLGIKNENCS